MGKHKVLVGNTYIELETHWEFKPNPERPSYVRITHDGKVIAYEQFSPPKEKNNG